MKLKFILLNCLVLANTANLYCISKEKLIHNARGTGFAVLSAGTAGMGACFAEVIYHNIKNRKLFKLELVRHLICPFAISSLMFYSSYKAGKKAYSYYINQPKETQHTQDAQVTKS